MSLHQIEGFTLALTAMLLYGLYMVPRKKSSASTSSFTMWMGWGILIGSTIVGAALNGITSVSFIHYILMFASGVVWATGTLGYTTGVQYIGLARSTPIKNTSAFIGTLIGVFALGEFAFGNIRPLMLAIAGSAAVVLSATLLGRVETPDEDRRNYTDRRRFVYGVLCSVWAAVAFSVYTIPMKIAYASGISPAAFLFYMGHGCFAGMAVLAIITRNAEVGKKRTTWRDRYLAILSGGMWAVGSLCANLAVKLVGVAITWPITKNTLVAVLYGVYILKEFDSRRHKKDLAWGLVMSVIGVLLLAFASHGK